MATSWRLARALVTLRDQVNAAHGLRDRAADGSIGDAAHAASVSDHNPDAYGIVRAVDITHDPDDGDADPRDDFDAGDLAEALRLGRDPRIKYVIWDHRIFSSTISPWTWRPYTGTNPHDHHVHVSVVADSRGDDPSPWRITPQGEEDDVTPEDHKAIAKEVWNLSVLTGGPDGEARPAHQLLSGMPARVWNLPLANAGDPRPAHQVVALAANPDRVAALVVDGLRPVLEAAGNLTPEELDASLRRVLGGLDES